MDTKFTTEAAEQLLEKSATDDVFREMLLGDPVTAMATLGIKIDQASVPAIRRLPSKAEARANAPGIRAALQSNDAMIIFFLA